MGVVPQLSSREKIPRTYIRRRKQCKYQHSCVYFHEGMGIYIAGTGHSFLQQPSRP